jgi:Phage portal protein, SPP1 Gp6-like.
MVTADYIKIIQDSAPMSIEKIIKTIIEEFEASPQYKMMQKAYNYYRNRNDICDKKRYNIINGIKVENNNLANSLISHPFLRDLVDQKIQYLLSNDWSIDDENYADYMNDHNRKIIQRIGTDSVNYGIGWLFVYPENNELKLDRMNPLNIIPVWGDNAHTKLEAVINRYVQIEYTLQQKKTITYAEWWDEDGVKVYRLNNGSFEPIEEKTHITDNNNRSYNWLKLPFIPLKYNDDELPLLQLIKPLIDEYDRISSDTADSMQDSIDKIKVFTGANGTDISELANNLRNYKICSLPENSDMKEIGTITDVSSSISHQDQLRRDIYDFGRGVDTNSNVGANASAAARQYLYAKLDLDCNQLESRCFRLFKKFNLVS